MQGRTPAEHCLEASAGPQKRLGGLVCIFHRCGVEGRNFVRLVVSRVGT